MARRETWANPFHDLGAEVFRGYAGLESHAFKKEKGESQPHTKEKNMYYAIGSLSKCLTGIMLWGINPFLGAYAIIDSALQMYQYTNERIKNTPMRGLGSIIANKSPRDWLIKPVTSYLDALVY